MVSTTSTTADGRIISVCAACAARPHGAGPADWQTPPPAAPYVPATPGSSKALVLVALVAVLGLAVAGATAALVLGRKRPPPRSPAAAPEAPALASEAATSSPSGERELTWDATRPLECKGNERITVRKGGGGTPTSVRAQDGCRITLIDCFFSGNDPLRADGNGELVLEGGKVVSTGGFAIRLDKNSSATVHGTTLVGVDNLVRLDDSAVLRLSEAKVLRDPNAEGRGRDPVAFDLRGDSELVLDRTAVQCKGNGAYLRDASLLLARDTNIATERSANQAWEPAALRMTASSVALLVGGSMKGPRVAVSIDDVASLSLQKTQLTGETRAEGNARVTVSKDAADGETPLDELLTTLRNRRAELKPEHEKISRYSKEACSGVFACYADNFPGGAVAGTVLMKVDASGKVVGTTLQGAIPPKVAGCIRSLGKDRTLERFDGPPGELVCSYSGQITKGMQMLSIQSDYRKAK